jgi:hypothetical protein
MEAEEKTMTFDDHVAMQFEFAVGEKFKYAKVPGDLIAVKDNYGNDHVFNVNTLVLSVIDSIGDIYGIDYKLRFYDGKKEVFSWYKQTELLMAVKQGVLI